MGETFSAEEARAAGLVNRIHDSAELEKAASEAAARIAAKPTHALAASRKLIRGDRADILKRMRDEADIWVELISSDEAKAAFTSFLSRGK
jgi:enoyl-CoA hydratase/carnithine racemase